MDTSLKEPSKNKKKVQTIVTSVGSGVIIALALAYVVIDYNNIMNFIIGGPMGKNNDIISIDAVHEEPDLSDKNRNPDDDSLSNVSVVIDNDKDKDEEIDNNDENQDEDPFANYPYHDLPCFDPNCPWHPGNNGDGTGDGWYYDEYDNYIRDPDGWNGNNPDDYVNWNESPVNYVSMSDVNFKGDSSEYVDPVAANDFLSGYIDAFDRYFEHYPNDKIYIVGGAARIYGWEKQDYLQPLSEARAEAVKQSFVSMGVPEDRLVPVGLGCYDPWRNDEYAHGYFEEAIAKTNRRVWIIPEGYTDQVHIIEDLVKNGVGSVGSVGSKSFDTIARNLALWMKDTDTEITDSVHISAFYERNHWVVDAITDNIIPGLGIKNGLDGYSGSYGDKFPEVSFYIEEYIAEQLSKAEFDASVINKVSFDISDRYAVTGLKTDYGKRDTEPEEQKIESDANQNYDDTLENLEISRMDDEENNDENDDSDMQMQDIVIESCFKTEKERNEALAKIVEEQRAEIVKTDKQGIDVFIHDNFAGMTNIATGDDSEYKGAYSVVIYFDESGKHISDSYVITYSIDDNNVIPTGETEKLLDIKESDEQFVSVGKIKFVLYEYDFIGRMFEGMNADSSAFENLLAEYDNNVRDFLVKMFEDSVKAVRDFKANLV